LEMTGPEHPSPAGLVVAASPALGGTPEPLTPLYLRRPDAAEPGRRKRVLR
jgi:tRNA threonylcarbamoyladenosine biosynthesis protein TsaB